jgi:hypothetical protein
LVSVPGRGVELGEHLGGTSEGRRSADVKERGRRKERTDPPAVMQRKGTTDNLLDDVGNLADLRDGPSLDEVNLEPHRQDRSREREGQHAAAGS